MCLFIYLHYFVFCESWCSHFEVPIRVVCVAVLVMVCGNSGTFIFLLKIFWSSFLFLQTRGRGYPRTSPTSLIRKQATQKEKSEGVCLKTPRTRFSLKGGGGGGGVWTPQTPPSRYAYGIEVFLIKFIFIDKLLNQDYLQLLYKLYFWRFNHTYIINSSISSLGDKTSYLKNVKCSGEPKNMAALTLEWMGQPSFWLYLFRLKSAIWTGQNLVS